MTKKFPERQKDSSSEVKGFIRFPERGMNCKQMLISDYVWSCKEIIRNILVEPHLTEINGLHYVLWIFITFLWVYNVLYMYYNSIRLLFQFVIVDNRLLSVDVE